MNFRGDEGIGPSIEGGEGPCGCNGFLEPGRRPDTGNQRYWYTPFRKGRETYSAVVAEFPSENRSERSGVRAREAAGAIRRPDESEPPG
ncbi:MAG: hypothetical protein AB1547_15405 [Thermodesulfobacteriota bacterium]